VETLFGDVSPALIIGMIIGLVEFAKKLGVSGEWSLLLSLGLGVLFGVAVQVADLYPVIAPWLRIVVYGILFSLSASGLYDFAAKRFPALTSK